MLISEKQKNLSWQVRTKDGMYFQPESLYALYGWIFENRLCSEDFIFSARDNDWIPIVKLPELQGCFWQLIGNGGVVYGPVSIGEMKQLFMNREITPIDKVTILGKHKWMAINEIALLYDWMQAKESFGIDYIQLVNKIEESFEIEEKDGKNTSRIKELEESKINLEKELKEKVVLVAELNEKLAQIEVVNTLKDTEINQLQLNIKSMESSISEKNKLIEESGKEGSSYIAGLEKALNNRENDLRELHDLVSKKEEEITGYRESLTKIQSEMAEKDRELAGADSASVDILDLKNEIDIYRQKIEEQTKTLDEKNEEIRIRDDVLNGLNHKLSGLEEEYKIKIRQWEESILTQKDESQKELLEKINVLEETLENEKEKWIKQKQDLEGALLVRDAQIESQKQDIERLQGAVISQDKNWQAKYREAKEEAEQIYNDLEKNRDNLQSEFTARINDLISEKEMLQTKLTDIVKSYEETGRREKLLKKDLLDRENFIESIKYEAKKEKESYLIQLKDAENKIYNANADIEVLKNKIGEFNSQLQDELGIQEGLKRNISILNEELANANSETEKVRQEKEVLKIEFADNKQKFADIQSQFERELEELRRNLAHAEEENRTMQKQFYLEKQKLTKDYTETINKQEKLQKRSQLEREIQDRGKMKDELERLYNLLKESFDGIQRGADEIKGSLQNLGEDIDNKRLSLKYITETEKREEKKAKPSQIEPQEE